MQLRDRQALSSGLYTADRKEWGYRCTFGMVQTVARNLDKMPPLDMIVVDEGHHSVADTYRRIIDRGYKLNSDMKLLLLTATSLRGDKKGLRSVVDNCFDQITLQELIKSGHLVPPRPFVIDIGVREQLQGVRKLIGDFDMDAVAAIMDRQVLNDRIVAEWSKLAGDRQTVVFCSTVDHADHVCAAFVAAGIAAMVVSGEVPGGERRRILDLYDRDEIQVICNVAVLTEGWDHQPTSCIV